MFAFNLHWREFSFYTYAVTRGVQIEEISKLG
jgi:hypothetical protein